MSRRPIFLLAVLVVLIYFSLIVFMLRPLHRTKHFSGNMINHLGLREAPRVNWCKNLRWRSPPSPAVVALVSFPGSGNTWLRYLLQQVTGIVTGSIYMDYGLRMHGFPAENVTDGSVLVVKTHEAPPLEPHKFKSAILLIRNPRDAILADFNRLHKGHIGTAPKSAFKKKNKHKRSGDKQVTDTIKISPDLGHEIQESDENSPFDWVGYVFSQLTLWESFHQMWLTKFPGPVHVLFYELLVKDTTTSLRGVLSFINYTVTEEDMDCAVVNREGIYRRRKKHENFEPFTKDMYIEIKKVKKSVLHMVTEYRKQNMTVYPHVK